MVELLSQECSHCKVIGTVVEGITSFYCDDCGWWGPAPDRMIYEPIDDENDWRVGQVPRRPTE